MERISVAAVNEADDVQFPIDSIKRANVAKEGRRSRSDPADILCCVSLNGPVVVYDQTGWILRVPRGIVID